MLSDELTEMGVQNELTEHGYVYARIPANTTKSDVPSIFFCSHVDTAFDCSGTDVKPIVHANYQGQDIILPDDNEQVISQEKFSELKNKIGHDVITASGLTLLGADDKSGVACIMDAVYNLVNNPDIIHGEVNVLFTTDEEIGRGVKYVDTSKIGAEFGYTLDSGDVGHFEYENFSADGAVLKIKGVSAHPGYAKGKMEHASRIAADILSQLPKDHLSPESTEGKEGFIHPSKIEGMLEEASIEFIIRSFETEKLAEYEALIENTAQKVLENYPGSSYTFEVHEQYRNMKDVVDKHMHIVDIAVKAMENAGVEPHISSIRGGTDGSVLSHMGLPCPNIFSGQHGIHSKLEWTTVQDMQKATDTVIEIIKLVERR
ncbi:MAG: tripeptide aminopeptidase [Halioglobus sp.]|jgi:tripeptide aminopeptidase